LSVKVLEVKVAIVSNILQLGLRPILLQQSQSLSSLYDRAMGAPKTELLLETSGILRLRNSRIRKLSQNIVLFQRSTVLDCSAAIYRYFAS
jgi:hypothetical protein